MKKLSLFIIIFISLSLCTCENVWMKEIMQTITVTFDTDGGTPVPPSQTFYRGDNKKVERPEDPTKTVTTVTSGTTNPSSTQTFNFKGWYTDIYYIEVNVDEEKSKRYDFDSVPTNDMVLHAGWENL